MNVYRPARPALLPVIDLSGGFSPSLASRQRVAGEIGAASRTHGFFYVRNHNVPQYLIDNLFETARQFFAMPADEKAKCTATTPFTARGYEGFNTQAFDPDAPADYKEGFVLGIERGPDHPYVKVGVHNQGANLWHPGQPVFRAASEDYFNATFRLGVDLMRLVALSLELPEDFFDSHFTDPIANLRVLHYPAHPKDAPPGQLGCGAHTDWGALTVLLQDDCGGLEVQGVDGEWIFAEPVEGTFVVNLGDLLARWTNDLYQSTPHRVMNNRSGRDRYSAAMFLDPNHYSQIECLPSCQSAGHPPKYPVCSAGEHNLEMYRRTHPTAPTA